MSAEVIRIVGARQNNLKNLSLDLPLHELIVITGVSGSGKSSLAFDTLYAEGQRRYVESFSAYARQFLERMDKPQVERVEGIPPAIAIDQSNPVKNSRSTVGTMTELTDHLRLCSPRLASCTVGSVVDPCSAAMPVSIVTCLLQEACWAELSSWAFPTHRPRASKARGHAPSTCNVSVLPGCWCRQGGAPGRCGAWPEAGTTRWRWWWTVWGYKPIAGRVWLDSLEQAMRFRAGHGQRASARWDSPEVQPASALSRLRYYLS